MNSKTKAFAVGIAVGMVAHYLYAQSKQTPAK